MWLARVIRAHSPNQCCRQSFSKPAKTQQNKKVQLNYKYTVRDDPPSIVHLSKHLTRRNKLEVDSEWFEKLSKSVRVCPILNRWTTRPAGRVSHINLVNGPATTSLSQLSWLERPTGIWEAICMDGFDSCRGLRIYFVLCSCHVEQFIRWFIFITFLFLPHFDVICDL